VNTGGSAYSPIPLNGDNSFRIAQQDGSENVIHIGENSFYMESSNCKNQNCVGQGEVTLENRESRPLFNMVICLPHNLSLELLTREEAEARLMEMYGKDPPPAA
ncbi:MAG: NusG domain II-containing protein, partial [Oscillospiraceae bacterium]|nr:NusG domain II-containing protein [Oscillospiraceae bacterium]